MNTIYKKILPTDVFISVLDIEPTEVQLWTGDIPNQFGNRSSGNDFIDLFAGLIRKHGHLPITTFAKMMGIESGELSISMRAMSGINGKQWMLEYLNLCACELLEKTDLSITDIGKRLRFSTVSFTRFFRLMNKCQPTEFRNLKKYGKKFRYHSS